jgi:hypothetical protein
MAASGIIENELPSQAYFAERFNISEKTMDRLNWSIAELLRKDYAHLRLRTVVISSALFKNVTLGSLLSDRFGLERFLSECRHLPHCGNTQITRIREALIDALKHAEQMPAEELSLKGVLYPDYVLSLEQIYIRMWRLAQFSPFVYAPSSIPEFSKTEAVLAVEIGEANAAAQYVKRLTPLRNTLNALQEVTGLIYIDAHTLETVLRRQGRYKKLSKDQAHEQHLALREMLIDLPKGVECIVTDFEAAKLSSSAIVGN